jgi:hypothetical protein
MFDASLYTLKLLRKPERRFSFHIIVPRGIQHILALQDFHTWTNERAHIIEVQYLGIEICVTNLTMGEVAIVDVWRIPNGISMRLSLYGRVS